MKIKLPFIYAEDYWQRMPGDFEDVAFSSTLRYGYFTVPDTLAADFLDEIEDDCAHYCSSVMWGGDFSDYPELVASAKRALPRIRAYMRAGQ